jgi:hypothetical protein
VATLERVAGSAIVGTGGDNASPGCFLGISPEANSAFHIHELDLYDPIVPKAVFDAWRQETGTVGGSEAFDHFCPTLTTLSEARQLGVGYLLEPSGHPGPPGTAYVTTLRPVNPHPGNPLLTAPVPESVYRVPGSAMVTTAPVGADGADPPAGAAGRAVPVDQRNPAHWRLVVGGTTSQLLRVHLIDVPGWSATIDGRPMSLHRVDEFVLQARIPPGRHVVELRYWPPAFTAGLVVALAVAVALAAGLVVDRRHRRRAGGPGGAGLAPAGTRSP